ncbi:MAG TPA: hypothetical protein DHM90_00105, partial [Clostridiaceae bacterium]|nr:hypothetical protein [Clostridiaceae bacterium]
MFNQSLFTEYYDFKRGIATGNNDLFIRFWWEVVFASNKSSQTMQSNKWYPYNKGGESRKWYGNREYLVNWESDGQAIRAYTNSAGKQGSRPQNTAFNFLENISYSSLAS